MGAAYREYDPEGFIVVPEGKEVPEGYRGEAYSTDALLAERLEEGLNGVYRIRASDAPAGSLRRRKGRADRVAEAT